MNASSSVVEFSLPSHLALPTMSMESVVTPPKSSFTAPRRHCWNWPKLRLPSTRVLSTAPSLSRPQSQGRSGTLGGPVPSQAFGMAWW